MEGYVPVTKDRLLLMTAESRIAADKDYDKKIKKTISGYISNDKKRSSTRKWYRFWILPSPRFLYNEDAVREYAANQYYEMFDGDPFVILEKKHDLGNIWLTQFQRVADSHNSSEPIYLTMDDFLRLDNPYDYHWCHHRSGWDIS